MRKTKLIFAVTTALLLAACNQAGDSTSSASSSQVSPSLVKKDVPVFNGKSEAAYYLPTYFLNGVKNIPYISAYDFLAKDKADSVDLIAGNGKVSYKDYSNNAELVVDYKTNSVSFSNFYDFFGSTDSPCTLCSWVDTDYFQEELVTDIYDTAKETVNLSDYDIHLALNQDDVLIPAQVAFALFNFDRPMAYNGSAYFYVDDIYNDDYKLTQLGAFYKSVPGTYVYDETLRSYAYNEMCMQLDFFYGMKDLRGYGSFDDLFEEKGIKDQFFKGEPDVNKIDPVMNQIFNVLLDDNGHTYVMSSGTSVFRETAFESDELTYGEVSEKNYKIYKTISAKKKELEIEDPYIIKGDTVFVNFDSFEYFSYDDDGQYITDDLSTSASIIKVVNDYIQSHDDEIKNVVINLTTDGGGEDEAELYTSSWIEGEAYQHTVGPCANDLREVGKYIADVNMDGKYDDKDNIKDKKVYLLTSNYTFSNANVLPGELKGSNNVTIIGQRTGGGSCNTLGYAGVLGNVYHVSSYTRVTNAEWESIETGVDPDIVLDDILATCDYDALLANYIHK